MKLTQEIIKELLHYDPDTGIFTWKERDIKWFTSDWNYKIWNNKWPNKICSSTMSDGYLRVCVLGKTYKQHRLAYLYMTGKWPNNMIDHEDGIKSNNKWSNLRLVNNSGNQKNAKLSTRNKTGYVGVSFCKNTNKYKSFIMDNKSKIHLGYFDKLEDAVNTRKEAELKYNYHKNHGRNA